MQRVCPTAKKMGEWFEKEDKSWLKQNPSISGAHRISSGQNCFLGIGNCNNPREGLSTEMVWNWYLSHLLPSIYYLIFPEQIGLCCRSILLFTENKCTHVQNNLFFGT